MSRPRTRIPLRDLKTYGRSHSVRLADFDYASDEPMHLTIRAAAGRPFETAAIANEICASVEQCSRLCSYDLFGFTLMPDHLHVLLSPGDSGIPIRDWLRRFKSFTTNQWVRLGGQAPLWQRSCYDHVCRNGETAESVLVYIIENPVRARLVERWKEWPWTKVFIEV